MKVKFDIHKRLIVHSLAPFSIASKAGLKAGDILCKPGSKGVYLQKSDQYLHNFSLQNNRPIMLEVWISVSDEDVMNDILKKKENELPILPKADKADVVLDTFCVSQKYTC